MPVAAEDLVRGDAVRRADRGRLPAGRSDRRGRDRLLLATDRGGNERHQLFAAVHDPSQPYEGPDDLEPLVVDPEHIHRPGGVTRDGAVGLRHQPR